MKTHPHLVLSILLLVILACRGQALAGVDDLKDSGRQSQSFASIGSQDGWVVGTGEWDNAGAQVDGNTSLRLGDEDGAGAHQIRSILSFDTSPLPDNAVVTSVRLVLKQESDVVGGGNPFHDFGGLLIDIKWGYFGSPHLESDDFQAIPDISSFGPYTPELADTYTFGLSRAAYPYINKWPVSGGLTQLRLRFTLDTDHNDRANYIHFYSGDEATEAWRPQLIIEYYLPSRIQIG
jgi:hypothetical protein